MRDIINFKHYRTDVRRTQIKFMESLDPFALLMDAGGEL